MWTGSAKVDIGLSWPVYKSSCFKLSIKSVMILCGIYIVGPSNEVSVLISVYIACHSPTSISLLISP
jgi:hypothetical protein